MRYGLAALFLFLPSLALAQALGSIGGSVSAPLVLTLSPQYPKPYASATLSVSSTVIDLANSTVSIFVNGTKIYSGNAQPVPITIGGLGRATTIRVVAVSQGQTYSQTLTVNPVDVSLVVEPLSSAPALYAGKPLVPSSGQVRLVALADLRSASGVRLNPSSLSYTWRQDGNVLQDSSGIGKNATVIAAPLPYRTTTISVSAASQDGSIVGSDSAAVAAQAPTVRIYQDDSLAGIRFDHALASNYNLNASEVSLIGVPYSFSTRSPSFVWSLDGQPVQTGSEITIRPQGQGRGASSLSLLATGASPIETATAGLILSFGSSASGSVFGL